MPQLPLDGACRCGEVRLKISAPPLLPVACHCLGCQRMTGSAFSLSLAVPSEGFAVTQGEPVLGGAEPHIGHYFCPHCLSWIFTRPVGLDWFVNVRTTMLDAAADFPPFAETYTSEKLPWATTPARRSFPQFPALEAWAELTEAYQRSIAGADQG